MKKKTVLGIALLLVVAAAVAQSGSRTFNYGFSGSGFSLQPIGENGANQDIKTRWGVALHGDLFYDLSARIQFRAGVGWKQQSISFLDYSPRFGCDINGGSFDPFNSFFEVLDRLNYLSIPLDARIKILGEVNHAYIRGGLELLILMNQNARSRIWECGRQPIAFMGANSIYKAKERNATARVGAGYEWRFLKKRKLFVEIMLDYGLSDLYGESNVLSSAASNVRVFGLGGTLGFRI